MKRKRKKKVRIAFHDDLWIEAERIRKEQQQERTRQRNRRKKQIKDLWDKLPAFRDNMSSVATLHIPCTKSLITSALNNEDFMVNTMADAKKYYYEP